MDTLKSVVILLVEDDPGDQKLIRKSLVSNRIMNDLRIANSGEEALLYLQEAKNQSPDHPYPELIFLDLNMPGMGGKEFLKKLKADEQLCTIPVVILTTSDTDKDILESYKLHASGYIKKPVSLDQFQEVMQDLSEYWFVICKRVPLGSQHEPKKDKCLISG